MNCPSCNDPVPTDAKFCPFCGANIVTPVTGETTRIGHQPVTGATQRLASTITTLRIGNINGILNITENSSLKQVRISLTGKAIDVRKFEVFEGNGELYIPGTLRMSSSVYHPAIQAVSFSLVTEEKEYYSILNCEIEVPRGMHIIIEDGYRGLTIGDLTGLLELRYRGAEGLTIGHIGDLDLITEGSGDIQIQDVTGSLRVQMNGRSGITINNGNMHDIHVTNAGSGYFYYGGFGTNADLVVESNGGMYLGDLTGTVAIINRGSGLIESNSIKGILRMEVASSGGVVINGGKAGPVQIINNGSGPTRFSGAASDVEIQTNSNGETYITSVQGALRITKRGSGYIGVDTINVRDLYIDAANSSNAIYLGGKAFNASITNGGSSTIELGDVSGEVSIINSSTNGINIGQGKATKLKIEARASGFTYYSGGAEDAELSVASTGGIFVNSVTSTLTARNNGSGTIELYGTHVTDLYAEINSNGGISYNGTADNGKLYNFGSGHISLRSSRGEFHIKKTSSGEVYFN